MFSILSGLSTAEYIVYEPESITAEIDCNGPRQKRYAFVRTSRHIIMIKLFCEESCPIICQYIYDQTDHKIKEYGTRDKLFNFQIHNSPHKLLQQTISLLSISVYIISVRRYKYRHIRIIIFFNPILLFYDNGLELNPHLYNIKNELRYLYTCRYLIL